ncbi:hypothetical protein BHE74_00001417 [Ensete ventricosum]|nr:hypothetical protein BHE74_00001417 [Ensete ventricosum]
MGNNIRRRRQVVDDKYTRPQGMYRHREIDYKKLRKLILESKFAPCYPGLEEYAYKLEECPICFSIVFFVPSLKLDSSVECFLQIKPPHATRPTQYPLSHLLMDLVLIEEQKVIEAQMRIRQQELQDEAERMKKRQNLSSSSRTMTPTDVGHHDISNTSTSGLPCAKLDLEDAMVMEAIWLSILQGSQGNPSRVGSYLPRPSTSGEWHSSRGTAPMRSPSSGGLACAAAASAERRHMHGNSAVRMAIDNAAACGMLQRPGSSPPGTTRFVHDNPPGHSTEISPGDGREVHGEEFGECLADHRSEVAEAGANYAGSEGNVETGATTGPLSEGGLSMPPGHFFFGSGKL